MRVTPDTSLGRPHPPLVRAPGCQPQALQKPSTVLSSPVYFMLKTFTSLKDGRSRRVLPASAHQTSHVEEATRRKVWGRSGRWPPSSPGNSAAAGRGRETADHTLQMLCMLSCARSVSVTHLCSHSRPQPHAALLNMRPCSTQVQRCWPRCFLESRFLYYCRSKERLRASSAAGDAAGVLHTCVIVGVYV